MWAYGCEAVTVRLEGREDWVMVISGVSGLKGVSPAASEGSSGSEVRSTIRCRFGVVVESKFGENRSFRGDADRLCVSSVASLAAEETIESRLSDDPN